MRKMRKYLGIIEGRYIGRKEILCYGENKTKIQKRYKEYAKETSSYYQDSKLIILRETDKKLYVSNPHYLNITRSWEISFNPPIFISTLKTGEIYSTARDAKEARKTLLRDLGEVDEEPAQKELKRLLR